LRSYVDSSNPSYLSHKDLLIVHGLTYSSHQFDLPIDDYNLVEALTERGFRVWLLDITGYGESQKPEDGFMVNSDYAAKDINAAANYILESQHVKKINVMGWSWGTITTSRFAAQHPEKIQKLILYAPIVHGLGLPDPENSYQPFSVLSAKSDFQLNQKGEIDPAITEPDVLKIYIDQVKHYDGKGSPNGGRKDLFQSKTTELIPYQKLTVPVLFIAGDHDPYVDTKDDFTLMMQHAPEHSCQKIIPGGGHALFLEKPYYHEFQKDLIRFLIKGC
jgi:pimeloyl-ACP methyl ester carboxylesterase